jgi:DUF4097 and DUF4098 domain-containing protein YvlB
VKTASGEVQARVVGGHLASSGASGDVQVEAVRGGATVRTASGDLRIGEVDGAVSVTGVSGDVSIGSLTSGSVQVRTVSGDIELGVEPGIGVWMDASSPSGDVSTNLDTTGSRPAEGSDLEITAASVSGDVVIRRAGARAARG